MTTLEKISHDTMAFMRGNYLGNIAVCTDEV